MNTFLQHERILDLRVHERESIHQATTCVYKSLDLDTWAVVIPRHDHVDTFLQYEGVQALRVCERRAGGLGDSIS